MSEATRVLLEESRKRRSYRAFLPDAIDMEDIKDIIMTASTAPSGANKQPWHFCVVTSPEVKQQIREESEKIEEIFYREKISEKWRSDLDHLNIDITKPFLTEAPCLIVVFAEQYTVDENGEKHANYYVPESVGLAMGLLVNAIRNAGLVSLTYTPAPPTFLRDILGRPENEKPLIVFAVGKPDPSFEPPAITKKSLEEIATFF